MKLTFLLFFTLLASNFSQTENENFSIESNQLIWQKIYETKLSRGEIIDEIKTTGKFENINMLENKLTANIVDLSIDYKGYGESEMSTPMYLSRSFVKAFLILEFEDEKYKVTIKNIKLVQKYDDGLSKANEVTEIENYALSKRNTEFKSSFLRKPARILNYTFSKLTGFN